MGFFRKSEARVAPAQKPGTPFTFRVDDMFTITGRGRVFTGVVESGEVVVGTSAELVLDDRVLPGRVARIEARRRKSQTLRSGETGGVFLDGINTEDLPLRHSDGDMRVDVKALKGALIRSSD
ncbi:elongation factor Tu [Gordonia malaquae]|uniref:elongation factor Tu n=1 Tax=Gordonia malaquae TaxID=410332 RepID=UPI0030C78D19